jgi:hypothetical protein
LKQLKIGHAATAPQVAASEIDILDLNLMIEIEAEIKLPEDGYKSI